MIVMALNDKTIFPILTAFLYQLTHFWLVGLWLHPTTKLEKDVNQIKDCEGSKHSQRNHKRVLNVRFCHKKLKIFSFSIWNHGNHGTLLFFNTHECQENQIKNPFDLILGFGLVKDFWNKNILSLKNDIFTKDF
jgi:hypothetical protein